jgi:FKBP-type peptidyl-prolyl cis-trans isomerase
MKKILLLALLPCLALPLAAQTKATPTPAPAATPKPSPTPTPTPTPSAADINYSLGLLVGQSLKNTGLDVNLDQVFQGIRDAQSTKPGKFSVDQAKQMVSDAINAAQEKKTAAAAETEKKFLADHAKKKGVVTTASGLQYEVITLGKGDKPKATDTVKVDYVGTLTDGTEFDSSVKRGEPAVFPLGQVIPAWTEGVQLMPVGSKFRFTVPSSLAYGAQGAGGVIPPYATLVFEVTLIDIEPPEAEAAPDPSAAPAQ